MKEVVGWANSHWLVLLAIRWSFGVLMGDPADKSSTLGDVNFPNEMSTWVNLFGLVICEACFNYQWEYIVIYYYYLLLLQSTFYLFPSLPSISALTAQVLFLRNVVRVSKFTFLTQHWPQHPHLAYAHLIMSYSHAQVLLDFICSPLVSTVCVVHIVVFYKFCWLKHSLVTLHMTHLCFFCSVSPDI